MISDDFHQLASTSRVLVWDLVELYVHVQIDKYQSVCGSERTPTTLVYVCLIDESQCEHSGRGLTIPMDQKTDSYSMSWN